METVNVTDNAVFARVKLGAIKPNRFRDLERWPVERPVIESLKQSINETGFWNNLQAIYNEYDEVELRFGHHRWAAGLELFGPDYEVAVEVVPFHGEWSLLRALHMENSVNRNKVMHTHEVVSQLARWWDDEVFEQFPTWEEAVDDERNFFGERAANFSSPLEKWFGEDFNGMGGPGNYAQCVKYGIGREVIAKMLEGTETKSAIEQALASLPLTNRRKRGLELQAEEERRQAEKLRAEADRLEAEREAERQRAEAEARKRQAEQDRIEAERRQAEAEAKAARDEKNRKAAEEKRRAADARMAQLKAEQAAKEASHKVTQEAKRQAAAKAETEARQAEIRAKQKEQVIESREWFDARASEVFDRPAHGAAFRIAVSSPDIRPYLKTEDLKPFAQAIRAHLERDEAAGRELTADRIRETVLFNYQTFKQGIKREEELRVKTVEAENPIPRLKRKVESASFAMHSAKEALGSLIAEIVSQNITAANFGLIGDEFDRSFTSLDKVIAEFKRIRTPK